MNCAEKLLESINFKSSFNLWLTVSPLFHTPDPDCSFFGAFTFNPEEPPNLFNTLKGSPKDF